MKTALRIGLIVLVMVGVGIFLGRGVFGGLNQDNKDVDKFNELVAQLNALESAPVGVTLKQAEGDLTGLNSDPAVASMPQKELEAKFMEKGKAFCSALSAYTSEEIVVLKNSDWPESMEKERAALEAWDSTAIATMTKCTEAKNANGVAKVLTDFDNDSQQGIKLTNALNKKAASIAE